MLLTNPRRLVLTTLPRLAGLLLDRPIEKLFRQIQCHRLPAKKLDELKASGADRWEILKAEMEDALDDLKKGA